MTVNESISNKAQTTGYVQEQDRQIKLCLQPMCSYTFLLYSAKFSIWWGGNIIVNIYNS